MNNIMKKLALGLAVMGTVGATAFASPSKRHGDNKPAKPAAAQVVKHNDANKPNNSKKIVINNYNISDSKHGGNHNASKPKPPQNSGHNMANNHKPSAHHAEPHRDGHHHHESHHSNSTLHTEDWVGIGAVLVGGLIGGLIGGAL